MRSRTCSSIVFFMFSFIGLFSSPAWSKTSFAILPVQVAGEASAGEGVTFENAFLNTLLLSKRYRIVDRQKVAQILNEQAFQQSGAVDPSEVIRIGRLAAVDKLLSIQLSKKGNQYTFTLTVHGVESGQVEFNDTATDTIGVDGLGKSATARLLDRYSLTGKVTAQAGSGFIVDLGTNDGLRQEQRLFIARQEVTRDENGMIVFENLSRVGIVRVKKVNPQTALVQSVSLADLNTPVQKGDLASPEPIPLQEPKISRTPLLPAAKPGKLILEDDMEGDRYLQISSGTGNRGDPYRDDEVFLDASDVERGHVFAFYGAPAQDLGDFIFEGDIAFEPETRGWGAAHFVFRSNREYVNAEGYVFFFTNEGVFDISYLRNGIGISILKAEPSPLLARGSKGDVRRIRLVAAGSQYDLYVDGKFLVGFEQEMLEGGGIGLWALQRTCLSLDNVKVWSVAPPSP
ncbi:MAG: CsgG/HfaB family protein [Bdellovibrionota bacterium]